MSAAESNAQETDSDAAQITLAGIEAQDSSPIATHGIERIPGRYIVEMELPPVAAFDGGIDGIGPVPRLADGRIDVDSQPALDYASLLREEQNRLIGTIEARIASEVAINHRYQHAFNGFSIELAGANVAQLENLPGVKAVHPVQLRQLLTDAGPEWIGADEIWNGASPGVPVGTRGEGIVVGIIDSGINNDHPSFAEVSAADGFVHTNPLGDGNFLGYCADNPGFCNNKLIGAYDFIWDLVSGIPDVDEDETPQDENGHGSHTAGTVAGNPVDTDFEGNAVQISGVAPRANMIIYDVCFDDPAAGLAGRCATDASIAAVNQVISDGLVNVVNYSISGGTNPYSDPVSQAFLNATNAGVTVVASAGNSGPGAETLGHQEPWTVTVGAATHNRWFAKSVSATGPDTPPDEIVDIVAIEGTGPVLETDIDAPIIDAGAVDAANVEGCSAFPAEAFTDAIALIARGGCAFADKVDNADAAGAIAVVVRLVAPGFPIVMGGLEGTQIPSLLIDQESGDALVNFTDANPDATARLNSALQRLLSRQGDVLAGFSSRGPNSAIDVLKPDVIAPGSSILAPIATPGAVGGTPTPGQTEIGLLSGTSMSSPHVAGTAALLKSLHPDWSPAEIKSALMATAKNDDIFKEDTVTPADPFDKGNGRVVAPDAAVSPLLLDESTESFDDANPTMGGDPRTLNLAGLMDSQCFPSCSWERTVTNSSGAAGTWEFSAESAPGVTLSAQPSQFTLGVGRSQTVTITADTAFAPTGQWAFGTATFTETTQGNGATTHFNTAVLPTPADSDNPNRLSKTAPPLVFREETIPYLISVVNTSTGEVTVSDTLPPEVEFVPGSQGVEVDGGTETAPLTFDNATNTLTWSGELDAAVFELQPNGSPFQGFFDIVAFGVTPIDCSTTCDEFFADFNTPEFTYNGATHTSVRVSTNGYLLPSSDFLDVSFIPQQLPDPAAPNNVIAPFWADMDLDGTDPADTGAGSLAAATFNLQGGGQAFIVQWTGVEIFDEPGTTYTFQVQIFDEASGVPGIWLVYDNIPSVDSNISVGVEGVNGQLGSSFYFSDGAGSTSGTAPEDGTALAVAEQAGGTAAIVFDAVAQDADGDAVNTVELQQAGETIQASQTTAIRQNPDIIFEDGFELP